MSSLFKCGKFLTKSSFENAAVPKRKYSEYKAEIIRTLKRHIELIEDPGKLIKQGKEKDPPYITKLSRVAEDLSFIELTLRCGRKFFDFRQKDEKYFKLSIPLEARTDEQVKALRIALVNELIQQVEDDQYKSQVKAYIRRQEKEGFDRKEDGWYFR